MMAYAEIDGVRTLREIEQPNDQIREYFLLHTRLLERIRGDVYVSGTYVRDYLLEPEAGKAESHRLSLLETLSFSRIEGVNVIPTSNPSGVMKH